MGHLLNRMPLAKWVNEVKLNTLDYMEAAAGLGYSRAVQRRRPGIAKADALPDNLVEDPALGSLVRATLADLDASLEGKIGVCLRQDGKPVSQAAVVLADARLVRERFPGRLLAFLRCVRKAGEVQPDRGDRGRLPGRGLRGRSELQRQRLRQ